MSLFLLAGEPAWANIPGGGTGTGANVTLTDNGTTVTMANGIASIVITKSSADIYTMNYTFNNTGSSRTLNLLSGGNGGSGGYLYWFQNSGTFITGPFTESVVTNNGDYAEISLFSASATNGTVEIHYSMQRGSPGFYTTAIVTHRSSDGVMHIELRPNIYAGSTFNWMSVDAARNRLMNVTGTAFALAVQGAPQECFLWTNGIYAGQYEDKYKYTANLDSLPAWGWSSVGTGGYNVGLWDVSPSAEYYPGGPMVRQLMEHIGTTILNVFTGNYYGLATDSGLNPGETWSHVYGPYFYYFNSVTNTLATSVAALGLYSDAVAQGVAEQAAWPYGWFNNTNYVPASGRGAVSGTVVIADGGNPNASAAGLWVGVVQQPSTTDGVCDFQQWMKPYQFWVKTDPNGSFSIPNVIAGTNYTLYAFGPGSPDTFMSQAQTGGSPPLIVDYPAAQFAVTVTGGATNQLGLVTWTPTRVGPTVFEIGYPDRTAAKFRHGDDYWVGDIGPSPAAPSPIWSKWLEYPFDFPNGPDYVVGQSRWSTDWNFIQPVETDSQGSYDNTSSTITFNLATAPATGATASLYLGLASDYYAALIVTVNGNNLGSVSGVTGTPNNSIPTTGYYVGYGSSDTSIREGNNAAFSDERLTFPAAQLHAGANTINIGIRQIGGSYFADHAMYDYLRLELTGYVPPAPAHVTAYAGNNASLVCWPVTPGATSYNVLRSATAGSGYVPITNGVAGPVCGSGTNNAVYLDATAANGATYYYAVQSVNPAGASASSAPSAAVTPNAGLAPGAPASPAGLVVGGAGHQSVTLNWTASANADFYSVWRSTLVNTGGGSSNTLSTIILNNTNTTTSYTDTSPTDGSIYSYFVTATGAGGTSGSSTPVVARALPAAPAPAPLALAIAFYQSTNIVLNWTAVPGAVGYAIYRATSAAGPFTFLQTVTETVYYDLGLNAGGTYYYQVMAVNAGGVSSPAANSVNGLQIAPASLSAVGSAAQVVLAWPAAAGATSYTLQRGTSSGHENITVVAGYAGLSYTNTGLVNDTTYYYVVTASGSGGTSGNSPEAGATAATAASGTWTAAANGAWSTGANWVNNQVAFGSGSTADFSTLSLPADLTVTLDGDRTISGLKFGDITAAHNWNLAGTSTLTLGASPSINVVNQSATISTVIAGTAGLAKTGPGALILGGAAETFTNGTGLNAGVCALDFTAANSPAANIIPAVNALALGGGTLQINGSSNTASGQTFAATTLNAGGSAVSAAPVSGTNLPVVTLGAITANAGGVVEFTGPATVGLGNGSVAASAVITTTLGGNGAFVGGASGAFYTASFATVGLYDFAATVGTAPPCTVVGGSQIAGFYTAGSGSTAVTAGNLDVTGNITGWSAQPYLTSLRCNTSLGASQTVSCSSYGSTLTLGDLLVTPNVGSYNVTFNNGTFRPAGGSSSSTGPLVVWQNNPAGQLILNTTLGNSKVGAATYVQAGPGTVAIPGTASGYTGQSYLNGGVTLIAGNGSLGPPVTAATVNLNGGTVAGNGSFAMDDAGTSLRPFTLTGNGGGLAATTGNTLTVDGVVSGSGPLFIGVPASGANGNVAGLLPGSGPGTANPTPVYAAGTVTLTNANTYTGGTILLGGTLNINGINALGGAGYGGLTFNGGTLQYAAGLTGNNGPADLTATGAAGITLAAGGGTIDLNGNAVTYAGAIGNNGSGALLVKSSSPNGRLTLSGANACNGTTTVTNATLLVNNPGGSATGAGDVTLQNGATLAGNGTLAGSVTVAGGATLAPENLPGTLTLGNNLALAPASTTWLRVQHSPLASDSVRIGGHLSAGGALIITNTGATALAAGDRFQLFTAGSFSGAFASLTLPALPGGLFWSTSQLAANGLLGVVSTNPPAIGRATVSASTFVVQGTGGTPNWPYTVLSSTNLALPPAQWSPITTNSFDANGDFTWTNAAYANGPQQFYVIKVQ